jgi:hypothetical protein
MPLSYLREDCYETSGYSYPRVTSIRIDVHPAGENSTNTPHGFHARSTYDPRPYVSHMVHIQQPFMKLSTHLNRSTALEKKGFRHNPQHDGCPIRGSIPSFSPKITNEAVRKSQASVDTQLVGLLGLYHQYAIGTFNTCSRGQIHRSLTDTGGCYNHEGAGLPQTTPRPSQPTISTFHLRAPPDLRLSLQQL